MHGGSAVRVLSDISDVRRILSADEVKARLLERRKAEDETTEQRIIGARTLAEFDALAAEMRLSLADFHTVRRDLFWRRYRVQI